MAKVILVKGFTENDRVHVRSVVLFGTTGRFCPAILSAIFPSYHMEKAGQIPAHHHNHYKRKGR
jgi:hypothetical protein